MDILAVEPATLLPEPDGVVPNNPLLPVLHYRGVLAGEGDLAGSFEGLFDAHSWPAAWRNGIFRFHHFHSTADPVFGSRGPLMRHWVS